MTELNRAYSLLDVKSINDGERVIEGIASTPTPDRMGDIVEPLGAKFALPMPLLLYHDSTQPVGEVFFAKPTKTGIPFKARVASVEEPGKVKDRLDEAWQSLKAQLLRAVSIGFRALEYSYLEGGGVRFSEWEWMELSLVAVPAQSEAVINSIKSADPHARERVLEQIKSADQAARRALQGKAGGHLVVHLPAVTRGSPGAPGKKAPRKGAVYL